MRINRLILDNYGLFSGRTEIDLSPRSRGQATRPIVLIGGMNGAGKTTLLDAVRLALYGKNAVGQRTSEKQYQEHLRGLVHRSRSALMQLDYARVGVEFDFVLRGTRETYYVQRCWSLRNGNGVSESFQVYRRDEASREGDYNTWPTLSELEPQHWQAFVSDVVPERLSQLFFFDGEKIQRIADDISGDSAIADALGSMLGLDTVGRLKSDLAILSTREAKQNLGSQDKEALLKLSSEIEAMEAAVVALEQNKAEVMTAILGLESQIARLERQLQEQGGTFAQDRPTKQALHRVLEAKIHDLQRQIRQECEGLLPLAFCPGMVASLAKQLQSEDRARSRTLLCKELEVLQEELVLNLSKGTTPSQEAGRYEAIQIVRETVAMHAAIRKREPGDELLIGFSEVDGGLVMDWMREAAMVSAETVRRLCRELEDKERETQGIRRQLDRAPDHLVLAPVFKDLAEQNQLLGQKFAELKALEDKLGTVQNQLAAKQREKARTLERIKESGERLERHRIVMNVQKALDKYLVRLTEMKVEALCRTATECFNRLSIKGDLLHHVSINPYTFEVKLYDRGRNMIPREELSAGEKQILAIAILWGLAKTSGRPLPVIIDTPLARLDSGHRMNLVNNYFPHAAHQVVLLSTDTEVDKLLFAKLQPYISHCYHLVYDKEDRRTVARKEYFWKERTHA